MMIASKDRTYCTRSILHRSGRVGPAGAIERHAPRSSHEVTVTKDGDGIQIEMPGRVMRVSDGEAREVLLALICMLSP
jgi:hypothetical protein